MVLGFRVSVLQGFGVLGGFRVLLGIQKPTALRLYPVIKGS